MREKFPRTAGYMLTIMCAATRFPEAIPLRNINAATVSKALIKFFTVFGLPKEIQSDQGSNFTSGLFQQVVYELGIKQITSSAYHPESQGSLERFHSTLKTMIRAYCFENEKDWDEGTRQLCHINMLKPYHNRPMKVVSVVHQPIVERSGED
uniref:Integrase catalytic domain-containing protein n=1 Tax=Takifugu rubripes TaxID=31033 RepID=A0A674MRA0_TAKRU